MRSPLIRGSAGVFATVLLMMLFGPIATAAAETAAKVPNDEEAWFLAKKEVLAEPTGEDPTCDLPTQCNASGQAMRPNSQPEQTLSVAANAGDPDAQTFFNFALTEKLPFGAVVTGGKVTMPIAQDPEARSSNPQNATMVACLVLGFIPGGAEGGSYKDRPKVDDKTCEPVKLVSENPVVFTVDLERFGKKWATGTEQNGITIMVDPKIQKPAPSETWRVLFNTRRRSEQKSAESKEQGTEVPYPQITSTLQYKVEKLDIPTFGGGDIGGGGDFSSGGDIGGGGDFSSGGGDFSSGGGGDFSSGGGDFAAGGATSGGDIGGGGFVAPPADTGGVIADPGTAEAPAVDAPVGGAEEVAQPQAAGAAVPTSANVGMSPAVWVVPLLALALAGAFWWSLASPVELAGQREGAVSRLMRTRRVAGAQTPDVA